LLADKLYLPFLGDDETERFAFSTPFTDPDGILGLSAKQMARLGGWKRPCEFMAKPTMINLVSAFAIKQDLVTDCSFVASLCISAAYERKMKKQLITSIIYPQDRLGKCVWTYTAHALA
jgi:calpain-7